MKIHNKKKQTKEHFAMKETILVQSFKTFVFHEIFDYLMPKQKQETEILKNEKPYVDFFVRIHIVEEKSSKFQKIKLQMMICKF